MFEDTFENIGQYLKNKRKVLIEEYGMPMTYRIEKYVKYTKIVNFLGLKLGIPEGHTFYINFGTFEGKRIIELSYREEMCCPKLIADDNGMCEEVDLRVFPGAVKFLKNLEKIYLEQERQKKEEKQRKREDRKRKEELLLSKLREDNEKGVRDDAQ
jgi:hypothetical protein